jgi:hypothetical protein
MKQQGILQKWKATVKNTLGGVLKGKSTKSD